MYPNPLHIHGIPEMCSRICCPCIMIDSPYFHPICKWWIHSSKWLPRAITDPGCAGVCCYDETAHCYLTEWWTSTIFLNSHIELLQASHSLVLEKPTNRYCNSMGTLHSWQDGSSAVLSLPTGSHQIHHVTLCQMFPSLHEVHSSVTWC